MRVIRIVVIGSTFSMAAFGVWMVSSGLLQAGAFLLAMFGVPVTIGIAIAAAWQIWEERPAIRMPHRLARAAFWRQRGPDHKQRPCTTCRKSMAQINFVWVCRACDHIAVPV